MGLGTFGHITRILSPAMGCEMVYASLAEDKKVIEGQVDVKTLLEMWNILNFGRIKKGLEKRANINW
jgi:3-dehydroquinate dehydratase